MFYSIGEICEARDQGLWHECEILAFGNPYDLCNPNGHPVDYTVDVSSLPNFKGTRWLVREKSLRKKRPPSEVTTWDECAWQPDGATV